MFWATIIPNHPKDWQELHAKKREIERKRIKERNPVYKTIFSKTTLCLQVISIRLTNLRLSCFHILFSPTKKKEIHYFLWHLKQKGIWLPIYDIIAPLKVNINKLLNKYNSVKKLSLCQKRKIKGKEKNKWRNKGP